mgnify:FL=1|tara:strand:- start:1448 stop:1753 length:306 start_codon:yes stop_codon:yes gene_type:complete
MRARIYKPCKTAMQSGRAKSDKWILEYFQTSATEREPIMGWLSGKDTQKQVKLKFNDLDSAIAYAEKNRISYQVSKVNNRKTKPKAYADNFSFYRKETWTH